MPAPHHHRELAIMYIHELSEGERFEFDIGIRSFYGDPLARLWVRNAKPRLNPVAVKLHRQPVGAAGLSHGHQTTTEGNRSDRQGLESSLGRHLLPRSFRATRRH
jgi:hypothetical protein